MEGHGVLGKKTLATNDLAETFFFSEPNLDTRPDGVDSIEVGYGLAVGEVFVSHLGDENYLQLAAIGEPTTLAARLCGVARGGQILVSEALAQDLGDKLPLGEKQELTLKGYDAPVTARTV